jgi:hypothetical protein
MPTSFPLAALALLGALCVLQSVANGEFNRYGVRFSKLKTGQRWAVGIFGLLLILGSCGAWLKLSQNEKKSNTTDSNPQQTHDISPVPKKESDSAPKTTPQSPSEWRDYTLNRVEDYHKAGDNVDCPNCKRMYCASVGPTDNGVPISEAVIESAETIAVMPVSNNHWYRCGTQASCFRPEFSDPQNYKLSCIGKSSCIVCRASDDENTNYEDRIRITFHRKQKP